MRIDRGRERLPVVRRRADEFHRRLVPSDLAFEAADLKTHE